MIEFDIKTRIKKIHADLAATDAVLVRYVEDIIMTLIATGILKIEAVPPVVKKQVINRQQLRKEMAELQELLNQKGEKK